MQVVADRLSLRWYLGYDLTEPLPDHSSLSRIRERYGLDIFRRFFETIVEQCLAAGLVWGAGTLHRRHEGRRQRRRSIRSSPASPLRRTSPSSSPQTRRATMRMRTWTMPDGADEADAPRDAADRPDGTGACRTGRRSAAPRHDWIGRAGRPDRAKTSGPIGARPTSASAPPIPMPRRCRWETGGRGLGYQDHYVVDGGRARIILTALVTPAEVQENQPALDLLWRTRFRWKLRPHQITGDTKYGTVANIVAIEDAGHPRLRSALRRRPASGNVRGPGLPLRRGSGRLSLPRRRVLRFLSQSDATHRRIYQAPAAACATCALRAQCTTSQRGRRISRSLDEAYLDRVRGYHTTEPYAKAMRKRQVWVEPLFAEAKDWHGLRRFRLRGLEKVNGEALLIAAGQNLKRLLSRPAGDAVRSRAEPPGSSSRAPSSRLP